MVGDTNIGIQAALGATDLYARHGIGLSSFYIDESRFVPNIDSVFSKNKFPEDVLVREMDSDDLHNVVAYDGSKCCIKRPKVVAMWLETCQYKYVAIKSGTVKGIVFARKSANYRISPLFADDTTIAHMLLHKVLHNLGEGKKIEVSIPVENKEAIAMFEEVGMTADHFVERCVRLNSKHNLPLKLQDTYCFTNYEPVLL